MTTPTQSPFKKRQRRRTLILPALWLAASFWWAWQILGPEADPGALFLVVPFAAGSVFFLINNWQVNHGGKGF